MRAPASKLPTRLRVRAFRDLGAGTWQIGGYGGIVAGDHVDQPSQVRFQVYLSRVERECETVDSKTGLAPRSSEFHRVELPVSTIGLVRPGDQWRDGQWFRSPLSTSQYTIKAPHPSGTLTLRAEQKERGHFVLCRRDGWWHALNGRSVAGRLPQVASVVGLQTLVAM